MSARRIQDPWLSDVLSTAGATPTVATNASFAPPSGSTGWVIVRAHARNTATGAGGSAEVRRPFENVAGVLSLTGSLVLTAAGALGTMLGTLAAAIIDVTTSGTTIQPRVTGIAATNIEWLVSAQYDVN